MIDNTKHENCTCERCGFNWPSKIAREGTIPRTCVNCKSYKWHSVATTEEDKEPAMAIGISVEKLMLILNGKTEPSLSVAVRIANHMGVSVEALILHLEGAAEEDDENFPSIMEHAKQIDEELRSVSVPA